MTPSQLSTKTYRIPALDCPEEFGLIRTGLSQLDGIVELAPDYINRSLKVQFDADILQADTIAAELRRIGFPAASPETAPAGASGHARAVRMRGTTLAGGLLLIAAAALQLANPTAWGPVWVPVLAVVSTILSGWPVARSALRAIRLGHLDMNVLMTIAAAGAIITAEWLEAATAMFLFGVALWLESYSMGRARRAVQTLVELTPTVAHRIGGTASPGVTGMGERANTSLPFTDVDPALLKVGDHVLVKPGERVPIDGQTISGSSTVNQAAITGESMPVDKTAGELVYAGSLNGEGALEIRATRLAHDSTLAHVARLVQQAQSSRSPTERFVDRFARHYTPVVILLAVLIALGPPLLAGWGVDWAAQYNLKQWIFRGLVMLVIACPCALVISTPVTIVCGLHQAARQGILIKGGQYLEEAARIDCVAIDKTGTLTTGVARVVAVKAAAGFSEEDVLRSAAALESSSEHPLATAIVAEARQRRLDWQPATLFTALRGLGVQGQLAGQTYYVASPRFFQDRQIGGDLPPEWLHGNEAATVALVGTQDRLLGGIYLADQPRPHAAAAIAELKQLGVRHLVVLTGDRREVAEHIARQVGIDQVHAELLPDAKVAMVQQLAAQYPHLAMVGDGVNDAPALAASRIGIALGSQASDTALETADVVVMTPQLSRLGQFLRLARRTRRLLSQNIVLALAIKLGVLVLAITGIATMWMAVAADVGASMLVIFNGMRLLSREKVRG